GSLAYMALLCVLLWSVGESLVRSRRIDFSTSLDALRSARLGPRGGRALLHGLGYGAGLAGLWLVLFAAAAALPGISPLGARFPLPLFSPAETLFPVQYLLDAAGTLLAIGLASYLPARWAPFAAVLLAPLFSPVSPLLYFDPRPLGLILGFAPSAVLVYAFHRSGLTAMLTAAIVSALFPAALLSGLHVAWAPATLAASMGLLAVVGLLGVWGLSRPAEVDAEGGRPPAFVRRLRAKRDRRYEMDLLAQMQRGLLPCQMLVADGYEIATHSAAHSGSEAAAEGNLYDLLQDDAGRLWVVTADVAGQGYSRAVAQAMIKAVLVSSMDGARERSDRLPSEILAETRRVLYREGPACESAALTLGRIDPRTGRAVVSCAGAPPPLLLAGGEVSPLSTPGPPLTPGSTAGYQDAELLLPPGGTLLFCSAGLFGAVDWSGIPFGQDHVRNELRSVGSEPAAAILHALLDGWRRHTNLEEPPAGNTILALRRRTREELTGDAAA
ncbi:MAG TPA: SpoIIE family protein phosphatase, partial [Thermoanaerobaculia bacterium]|nr:SpoIIE family protein phosphatase [Thermoanaerobaculia bacterium]